MNDDHYQRVSDFLKASINSRGSYEKQLEAPLSDSADDKFLTAIQGVESNFGQNTDHPKISYGIQAGDKAIGNYAIMPNTIKELANKVSNTSSSLGSVLPYNSDLHDVKDLAGLNNEQIDSKVSQSPELQNKIARLLQKDVMLRSKDPQEAAYRWNNGQNIKRGAITPEMLANSEYVQKFNKIRNSLNPPILAGNE